MKLRLKYSFSRRPLHHTAIPLNVINERWSVFVIFPSIKVRTQTRIFSLILSICSGAATFVAFQVYAIVDVAV